MKNEEKGKTKQIIKIVVPIVALVMIIGISYALWQITREQQSANVITTLDCLDVEMVDISTEGIVLANAAPLTDEEGMKTKPYVFSIKNNCSGDIVSDINLEVLSVQV